MEFSDILASLRRRWRIGVGVMLISVAVLSAFYVTRKEEEPRPRFRAENDVLVPKRGDDGEFPEGVPPQLFFGQAALATSEETRSQALVNAQVPEEQLNNIVFAYKQNEEGDIITLTVTAGNPATATNVANGWGAAFQDARGEIAATGSADARDQTYRGLQVATQRLRAIEAELGRIDPVLLTLAPGTAGGGAGPPTLNVPADVPLDASLLVYERASTIAGIDAARTQWVIEKGQAQSPSPNATVVDVRTAGNITPPVASPSTPTFLILGIGLLLALAVPILIDRMDHTIRDAKTAAAAFSAPVLSSIPASRSRRYEIARPGTAREGAFRALAAMSVATDRLPRSIVVTSPLGEEQDSVAANFAAALANLGVRVALVGTSPRHAWFSETARVDAGGSEPTTFPQMLELAYAGSLNGEAPRYLQRSTIDNLLLLPPGQRDIDVSTDGLAPMLQALTSANIDVTVIAAPALLQDPNTTIYAWTTRSVLWVMETGELTVEEAREAANRLTLAGVTPFGVAMIDQEP